MDEKWTCEHCTFENSTQYRKCKLCKNHIARRDPSLPNESSDHPLYKTEEGPQSDGGHRWSTDVIPDDELRIVFIGRTGSGKSATGNNILNEEAFESSTCGSSVTKKCQRGKASRFNRYIQIIDSPGLFDTEMSNGDITREIVKCVGMTAPGPHAFVLVVRIDRFTKEENETVQHFRQVFGDGMLDYLIILFTRKDDLAHEGKTLMEYLKKVPQDLQDLAKACNNRCIAFNNHGSEEERDTDVQEFLKLVDNVLVCNGDKSYTSEMYVEAEKNMKKREEELRMEHEIKTQKERDAIRREFERKFKRQHDEQKDVTSQLHGRIKELEQQRDESKKKGSDAGVADLCKEMESLKLALKGMIGEKEKADRKLQLEKERKEREALKRLEAEKRDFREQAREELNKEKPGFWEILGSVLKKLVTAALPSAGMLLFKVFKR